MSNDRNRLWMNLSLALSLCIGAGAAGANEGGFSQYIAGKNHDSRPLKIWNPTGFETFALYISYNGKTGAFDECDSMILPPKTRNDDDITYDSKTDAFWEILAVPTTGGAAGRFSKKYGVNGKDRGGRTPALMNPKEYKLPVRDGTRKKVVECACQELDDAVLSPTLLKNFGINCPD